MLYPQSLKFDPKVTPELAKKIIANYYNAVSDYGNTDYRGQTGTFLVYGSDQSGSFSSSSVPLLAVISGKFEEVLEVAARLELFTYWSAENGGRIVKVETHNAAACLEQFRQKEPA